ncbi:hypothetical protein AV530_017149 [Patagioenas fasciata monilis]|uniref:Integrase catalytic domain-containing protein n=1 Tax=Patagioenas fasciata monilis TaxID=372326 RepID=A0A1V4JFC9_PATFA|nr:hypothetical protein AV530_017149 [Patagioenas fasciata monilis]
MGVVVDLANQALLHCPQSDVAVIPASHRVWARSKLDCGQIDAIVAIKGPDPPPQPQPLALNQVTPLRISAVAKYPDIMAAISRGSEVPLGFHNTPAICHAHTREENLEVLAEVLEAIQKTGFKKVSAPADATTLRSFLALLRFSREFIEGYAEKAAPLCHLLKKDTPWEWGPEQDEALASAGRGLQATLGQQHVRYLLSGTGDEGPLRCPRMANWALALANKEVPMKAGEPSPGIYRVSSLSLAQAKEKGYVVWFVDGSNYHKEGAAELVAVTVALENTPADQPLAIFSDSGWVLLYLARLAEQRVRPAQIIKVKAHKKGTEEAKWNKEADAKAKQDPSIRELVQGREYKGCKGHLGTDKTMVKLQGTGWWPEMREDVERYCLVISDNFTKWVEAFPARNNMASTTAKILVEHIFSRWGIPKEIYSDHGQHFIAEVTKGVCQALGVKQKLHIMGHFQKASSAEGPNQPLKMALRKLMNQQRKDWDQKLPLVLLALRGAMASQAPSPQKLPPARDPNLLGHWWQRGEPPDELQPRVLMDRWVQDILRTVLTTYHQLTSVQETNIPKIDKQLGALLRPVEWNTGDLGTRARRDLLATALGGGGAGLGVLNSMSTEVLANKLEAVTSGMHGILNPLNSSLASLGMGQWLVSEVLPTWEQISILRDGDNGVLPTEIRKIVWDAATEKERQLQAWWRLVNFTHDQALNAVVAHVLTVAEARIEKVYPIVALGVMERIKRVGEHHWWEIFLGWSPTATGIFNTLLHPIVFLLLLQICVCFAMVAICYRMRQVNRDIENQVKRVGVAKLLLP